MKLFLTWLLGVPVLVTFMVIAQARLASGPSDARVRADLQPCSVQGDAYPVAPVVAQQGYGISCNPLTIH